MNLETLFSEAERRQIDEAVAAAEKRTAAEIVPVVTDASGDYDRAEDLFGLVLAVIAVIVGWLGWQRVVPETAWTIAERPDLAFDLHCIVGTIVVGFLAGAVIASKVWFIRHLFTPRRQMRDCVSRGAQRAFQEFNLARTAGATGVLIYVSLFERMVVVLGDETVAATLSHDDFAEVRDAILAGFKTGQPAAGMCEGIRRCGDKLTAPFPIQPGDIDELPNTLRLYAQRL